MRIAAGFLIRLALYALALGLVARAADWLWTRNRLDGVGELAALHDAGMLALALAPIVLAVLGVGPLRSAAVFAAAFLGGAAVTAPFAFARLAGG